MTYSVLIVEDDAAIAAVIAEALGEEGYDVALCSRIDRRDELLAERSFDVMLTDVMLEDGDGLASIAAVHAAAPQMPIIVLSAQNTLDTAVRASDSQAFEYFPKPFDLDELTKAVAQAAARRPSPGPRSDPAEDMPFIGRSQAMQGVYRMISRVVRNDLTVLVTGESGTGKELVAEAIHELGARKTGPFVAVNAAAIPQDLIESELFGHEKGAFTGALNQAIGKFEQANGGTLFLDEIGDMPAQAQTRLLRALQSGRIRRVGGRHDIAVDVRIIAATNRNLAPMIAEGSFREDLYYRLNVVPIPMPPLRERREDIAALARHFLALAEREGLPRRTIAEDAVEALAEREWPGNVRELRNVVFRLALIARNETIDRAIVDENLPGLRAEEGGGSDGGFANALSTWLANRAVPSGTLYHAALAEFEKPLLEHAMRETEGNQVRAAQLLGINRNTLRKKIGDLGIEPDRYARRR
tara:strand:- start:989 stop:2398 length:1410 start_codon:yes stop_codon:yes gene_type:complete